MSEAVSKVQQRQKIDREIRQWVDRWAPRKPVIRRIPLDQAKKEPSQQHWFLAIRCIGKGADFDNIGRWIEKCTNTPANGHSCSGFGRWLTMAFNEERLAKLRDLKVKYELTGKKWRNEDGREVSDNEDPVPAKGMDWPTSSISSSIGKVAGKPAVAAQSAPPAKVNTNHIGRPHVHWSSVSVPKVAGPSKIAGSKPAISLPSSAATGSSKNSVSAGSSASAAGRFPFQERSSKKRKASKRVGKVIEFDSYGNEVLEFSSDDGGFIDCGFIDLT
ncbi:hypothetical protein C8J56DRAFT_1059733 [Mycena floridula]|nr:hypothetical protein C8J56DRAFT_1059733 [Mycena floridula]